MNFNCDIPIYVGPLFLLLGLMALTFGAIAWDLPLPGGFLEAISFLHTETAAPGARRRWTWRLLGPLNGSVFVIVGLYIIWGTLNCHPLNLGIPNISGAMAVTAWPGVTPATLFAGGLGIYNARQMNANATRVLYVLLVVAFGFAGGQAAGFHTGPHATQWGVVAFASLLLSCAVWFVDSRLRGKLA